MVILILILSLLFLQVVGGEPIMSSRVDSFLRIITNIFLFTIISIVAIDTFPFGNIGLVKIKAVERVQAKLTYHLLDRIGFWQGIWGLFAPEPFLIDNRLSAILTYEDGQVREWKSLNFTEMNYWEWKRHNRMISYIQNIQEKDARKHQIFKPLVYYLEWSQTIPDKEGNPQHPVHITLNRHVKRILPPLPPNKTNEHWLLGEPMKRRWGEEETYEMCQWERSN